jgi:hypothetical protein
MVDDISQPAQYLCNPPDPIKWRLGILFVNQVHDLKIVRYNTPLLIIIAGPAKPD